MPWPRSGLVCSFSALTNAARFGSLTSVSTKARVQPPLIVGDLPHPTFRRRDLRVDEQIVKLAVEGMDEQLRLALAR